MKQATVSPFAFVWQNWRTFHCVARGLHTCSSGENTKLEGEKKEKRCWANASEATSKGAQRPTRRGVGWASGFRPGSDLALLMFSVDTSGDFCESWNSQMWKCSHLPLLVCLPVHNPSCGHRFPVKVLIILSTWSFSKKSISPHSRRLNGYVPSQEFTSSASTKLTHVWTSWTVQSAYVSSVCLLGVTIYDKQRGFQKNMTVFQIWFL